jgi:hypothetical protein
MDRMRHDRLRFGAFELDLRAQELRRQGRKVKLRGQPLQVLALLLEKLSRGRSFTRRSGPRTPSLISTTASTLPSRGFAKPWVTLPSTPR